MKILSLDLATKTGYAVVSMGKGGAVIVHESGLIDCSIRTKATKTIQADHLGKRPALLLKALNGLTGKHPDIEVIAIEAITQGATAGGRTSAVARWLEAVALLVSYEQEMAFLSYSAGTIKKHATGDGSWRTKKEQMIAAAQRRWPRLKVTDDNIADALHLGSLALERFETHKRLTN